MRQISLDLNARPRRLFIGAITVMALSLAQMVTAQDTGSPPEPEGTNEAPSLLERTIYIPYEEFAETFEKQGRGVFLPYEQFRELWQRARQADGSTQDIDVDPPLEGLIQGIQSVARVRGDVLQIDSTLQLELLRPGWQKIALRLAGAAIQKAQIDGRPARILGSADAGYEILLDHDAEQEQTYALKLSYAVPIVKQPGRNSATVATPLAAIHRWEIRLPESGVDVVVSPTVAQTLAAGSTDSSDPNGSDESTEGTVVEAFVGATPQVQISWTPRSEGASGLAALATVSTDQRVTIEPGLMRSTTVLNYQIRRAKLRELRFAVPASQKVVGVYDSNVKKWGVSQEEDRQVVEVELFQPAQGHQRLTVETESFLEDESNQEETPDETGRRVSIPEIQALEVSRQQGQVSVQISSALRSEVQTKQGLIQVDSGQPQEADASQPSRYFFQYAQFPYQLVLSVAEVKPEIDVTSLVEAFLQPQRLSLRSQLIYDIRRAGIYELVMTIPAGMEVQQVTGLAVEGATAAQVDSFRVVTDEQNGTQKIVVSLSGKAFGRTGLLVSTSQNLQEPRLLVPSDESIGFRIALADSTQDIGTVVGQQLVIYAPDSLRVAAQNAVNLVEIDNQEAITGWKNDREGALATLKPVLALRRVIGSPSVPTVQLEVQRRRPYITARQFLSSEIDSGVVKYRLHLFYNIQYSGVKNLLVDIPADIATLVRNETPGIRDQVVTPDEDDAQPASDSNQTEEANEWVRWQFSQGSEFLGDHKIELAWEVPLENLELGKPTEIVVPRIAPQFVDRNWGQIVVTKPETIDVIPRGVPEGLRPIDPRLDLMPGIASPQAVLAMEFHDDWSLRLDATRYQLTETKPTSIDRALVRAVVTRSGQMAVQALYRLKSTQQRLAVRFPQSVDESGIELDTEPLRIDGQVVPLEKGSDSQTFYIPLTSTDANSARIVELRYALRDWDKRVALPSFPEDPALQEVYIALFVPEDWTFLGSRGPWTDCMEWTKPAGRPPLPVLHRSIDSVMDAVVEGKPTAASAAKNFPTEGTPLLFSAIRPEPPPQGSLRISVVSRRGFQIVALLAMVALGAVVTGRAWSLRIVAVVAGIAALILVGLFFPTLSEQITGNLIVVGVGLIVLIWLAAFFVQGDANRLYRRINRRARAWKSSHTRDSSVSDASGAADPAAEEGDKS